MKNLLNKSMVNYIIQLLFAVVIAIGVLKFIFTGTITGAELLSVFNLMIGALFLNKHNIDTK